MSVDIHVVVSNTVIVVAGNMVNVLLSENLASSGANFSRYSGS